MDYTDINLQTSSRKRTRLPLPEFGLIAFFLYYYLVPSASNEISFMLVLGIAVLYTFYVLLFTNASQQVKSLIVKVFICVVIVTLCYFFLTQTKTIDTTVDNYELKRFFSKFQQLFFTFFPLLITYRLLKYNDKNQKIGLLAFAVGIIIYVMIKTFNELSVNDTATRAWSEFSKMEAQDIATYNFVYAISVSIPVAFALILNTKTLIKKIAMIAYLCVGFVFLISAKYTLSLLISAMLCYVAIFLNTKSKNTKILAAVITPMILVLLPYILEFVANHVVSGGMSVRLLEVSRYFTGEAMGYNMNGRFVLYRDTLQAFFRSPFIGNASLKFDGHATFLTVLSDVGLLGSIPFYWLYFSTRKNVNMILKDKTQEKCFLLSFLALILTGFVNPIHAALPLPMVAWFVLPLVITVFVDKTPQIEENKEIKNEKVGK